MAVMQVTRLCPGSGLTGMPLSREATPVPPGLAYHSRCSVQDGGLYSYIRPTCSSRDDDTHARCELATFTGTGTACLEQRKKRTHLQACRATLPMQLICTNRARIRRNSVRGI